MSRKQLLFVTYQDNGLYEGLSYAIDLAKAMAEDIVMLLVRKRDTLSQRFEDLMVGAAFAEEGEHETAIRLAGPENGSEKAKLNGTFTEMVLKASKEGVHLSAESTDKDVLAGVRNFVKHNSDVDKVVLSPSVTEGEVLTSRDLNRLVRTASRPVVTMTRQSVRAVKAPRRAEERPAAHTTGRTSTDSNERR